MRRAIVTGGTKSDVAAMAVLAINIRETNAHLFDKLIVYHDGISEKDQKLVQSFFDTEFIRYRLPYKSKNDEIVNHFTPMVFCKFECLKLLEEYDEVAWIDYDVVIKGALDSAFDFSNSNLNYMCGKIKLKDMFYSQIVNESIHRYDLEAKAFHAAFFSISNSIGEVDNLYEFCYKKAQEWDEDIFLPEQCVFAAMLQEYSIKTKKLDESIYSCEPELDDGKAIILHAVGSRKFWNGRDNAEWNRRYDMWIKNGGKRYSEKAKNWNRKVRFLITRMRGMRGKTHV